MAKECTEPRNMATVQCRNCDEYGHFSKECPKPRDSKDIPLTYTFRTAVPASLPPPPTTFFADRRR